MKFLIQTVRVVALVGVVALGACSKPAEQNAQQGAAASDPAPGPKPTGGMIMQNAIVIVNSGSTNTIGYRIIVGADGSASHVSGDGSGHAMLSDELYARLKSDVAAAGPLSQMPMAVGCVKSASFGTTTTIAMGGETSPDLSCAGSEASKKLKEDVDAVVAALKIRNVPRGGGKELPPQNQ
jgi:hypothetical protein